ncbi:unnamed protein product [Porites evermanni]|uniref:Myb/SANT-like DNA-binding domain-containing protein n=1 Tax=Porites evermanni TaxID=104178 RepID=A0ABN8LEN2_9CNID|nr:unnamed protein product [Porites evermanni]
MPGCSEPSAGISQAETCGEKGEKYRRTSWEPAEVRSLIAAYRDNYDRVTSTKSSHGKKSVWDSIMKDFLSLCSDAGIGTEKTLVQVKEKWRSFFDKYKAVKDNNNKTGRDRRTFEFYDEIDEFLSRSDKVNPKFVKETRVMQDSPTSSDSGSSDASATKMRKMIHPVNQKRRRREQALKERRQKVPFSISWRHNKLPSRKQTRKTNGCSRLC